MPMTTDSCPKCGGKMFYDNYKQEHYCGNCGFRVGVKRWLQLQQLRTSDPVQYASFVSSLKPNPGSIEKERERYGEEN